MTLVKNPNLKFVNLDGFQPKECTEILSNTVPEINENFSQLAYGRRAVPKLVSEVESDDLALKTHAIINLVELFHNPEFISQGLEEDIVPKLTKLLKNSNLTIKQKTTECLSTISGYALGRTALIEENTLLNLSKAFDDEDPLVRKNAHLTFARVTSQQAGVDNILPWGSIPILVNKLPTERVDIQCIILDCLYNCIRMGPKPWIPDDPLKCDAMGVFTDLINPSAVTQVKVGTAKCIMMLSFNPEGKKRAVSGKTVPILIDSLTDLKSEVRAAVAGALMSITIDVDAKRLIVRENAIPTLMRLLDDKNESVLLNVIKTITNCAEDYRGRFQLHGCIKKVS
ncbi:Radial spoke head 14 [Lobulomyces angularis]|nr:Radial spoke head 14 [Lobulomyces angularis]